MDFKLLFVIFLISIITISCDEENVKEQPEEILTEEAKAEVQWVYNLDEGFKLSKEGNKPLMVYFTAEWCPPCRKLSSEVYTNSEVIKLSKNFVCVKIDIDKNRDEAQKYDIKGVPTIIFINPNGEIIERVVGYRNSEFFINIMQKLIQ